MSNFRKGLTLMLVLGVCLVMVWRLVYFPSFLFIQRISSADRITARISHQSETIPLNRTMTGNEARQVVQMVAAGRRDTAKYACVFDVVVTFYRDEESLGEIRACPSLFLIQGKQYRDPTGILETLIVTPLFKDYAEWRYRQPLPQ